MGEGQGRGWCTNSRMFWHHPLTPTLPRACKQAQREKDWPSHAGQGDDGGGGRCVRRGGCAPVPVVGGEGDEDLALGVLRDIVEIEGAGALLGAPLPQGQKRDSRPYACRSRGRHSRLGASWRSSRAPTISLRPSSLAARCARTTPDNVLRSVTAIAASPSACACATSSSPCEAPRRNEKLVVTCSSA